MMRAIVLNGYGGLERLTIKELPDPEPRAGHVLITITARIRCRTLPLQLQRRITSFQIANNR